MTANQPRILRSVKLSAGGQIGTIAFGGVAAMLSARWLGPSGRGVLSLVTTGAGIGAVIFSAGIPSALGAFSARGELEIRRALRLSLALTLIAVFLTGLCGLVWLAMADSAETLALAVLALGAGALVLNMTQGAVAIGVGRVDAYVSNTLLSAALTLVAYGIGAAIAGTRQATAWAMVGWLASQSAGDVLGWHLILGGSVRALGGKAAARGRDLMKFALAAYPGSIIAHMNLRADLLVLGLLTSLDEVGVYSIAALGIMIVMIVPGAIGQALTRPLGIGAAGGQAELISTGIRFSWMSALVSGALGVIIARALAVPLLGAGYSQVATLMAVSLPGLVLFSPAHVTSAYFNVDRRLPHINGIVAAVSVAIDLAVLVALAPQLGGLGAAIAASAGYATGGALNLVIYSRLARVRLVTTIVPSSRDAALAKAVVSASISDWRRKEGGDMGSTIKNLGKRALAEIKGVRTRGNASVHPTVRVVGRGRATLSSGTSIGPRAQLQAKAGRIEIAERTLVRTGVCIQADDGQISIGSRCSIMYYTLIYGQGGVTIGDDVLIGNHCLISSVDHTWAGREFVGLQPMREGRVTIECGAWIGAFTAIMAGVTIGEGAIVGSHSLVRHDVPPYTVWGGTPAREIGRRVSAEQE